MMSASGHWSNDRSLVSKADIHRVVGGPLNLLRELARISCALDTTIPADVMIKRVQFLAYELQSELHQEQLRSAHPENALGESEKLGVLNRFFFESKHFCCVDPARLTDPSEAYRLNRVLMNRNGAPIVLELLYAFLAEKIGVGLDFVDLKPLGFLRWPHSGRARYIDITRHGSTLSSDEMIETLHTRFQMSAISTESVLEDLSFESFITDYVSALKNVTDGGHEPERLLFLQDTLISYQPSNLTLVGERALLHRRLGNFKSALSDLKRYFAFHDRLRAPVELVRLHDELIAMMGSANP